MKEEVVVSGWVGVWYVCMLLCYVGICMCVCGVCVCMVCKYESHYDNSNTAVYGAYF